MTLFPGFIRGGIGPLGAAAKAAEPWWLAGGISASACVAAYQPKGAASYAASKVNLANPGTYNLTKLSLEVDWDAENGFKFAANTRLNTGVTGIQQTWSAIIRYSGATPNGVYASLFGVGTYNPIYSFLITAPSAIRHAAYNGATQTATETYTSHNIAAGVLAIAGGTWYEYDNGAMYSGSIRGNTEFTTTTTFRIGGAVVELATVNVQAVSLYNVTLTAAQVAALTTAMNAL